KRGIPHKKEFSARSVFSARIERLQALGDAISAKGSPLDMKVCRATETPEFCEANGITLLLAQDHLEILHLSLAKNRERHLLAGTVAIDHGEKVGMRFHLLAVNSEDMIGGVRVDNGLFIENRSLAAGLFPHAVAT